ncbi:16S rRNA (guanine(966)-N(2))-methyltransferase RsmD [Chlorobium sp. N1]|uniref:16S rRNA (guanine(966)-N(2))-methyltransferase RsmD n=1 Tax=Chlorobium sp. N1 TaxID=2491138 RepID=UPI00103889F8|nr:16S rRNA (guanine(966)-N(2))-methyltransferase RsmD [Chlorobium sp. N1]TCD47172.1 16S rRNA (guanine(966)-N(2))-methyltransferase RsmD [Chlorobium sp. N1]
MQIIAGTYRGRKIKTTPIRDVRPCSSRVKKSIFDTLHARMDFEGIDVLDLFAGFGSLGFEALSRGARSVTFVDRLRDSVRSLESTARQLGVADAARIVCEEVPAFIGRGSGPYDLVFCDPPYAWPDYGPLILGVMEGGLLEEDGWLLIEHDAHHDFSDRPFYSFHRDYGMTRITFFQHRPSRP